ncbi:MAG: hypothetical protein WBV77_16730, partial [Solirubrobacteraceae bacterium]
MALRFDQESSEAAMRWHHRLALCVAQPVLLSPPAEAPPAGPPAGGAPVAPGAPAGRLKAPVSALRHFAEAALNCEL